jgi:phage shock protein PspC (stress-responsive transcriptional regulator)
MALVRKTDGSQKLCGICAGIADATDLDVSIIRFVTVLLTLFTSGVFFFVYWIAVFCIPAQPLTTKQLFSTGEDEDDDDDFENDEYWADLDLGHDIFLIEKLELDSLATDASKAVQYKLVGYVFTKGEAVCVVAEGRTVPKKECWAMTQDMEEFRYKVLSLYEDR